MIHRAEHPHQTPAARFAAAPTREEIARRIRELGHWFHNMDLGGVQTAPDHFLGDYPAVKWRHLTDAVPHDLHGWTVLDVGCNAGFYSQEMKRRGADRVLGIDTSERYLAQARFAADIAGLDIEFRRMSVYDLPSLAERFDLVLFMGVLYHLRHPLLALDILYVHAVRHLLVFQSMLRGARHVSPVAPDYDFNDPSPFDDEAYPRLYFVEHRYAGDQTNWWIPNSACAQAMLRSAGFEIEQQPEEEVFICRRAPALPLDRLPDEELPWLKP